MELEDIISSSLIKDMQELRLLHERKKDIKEECNKHIQELKTYIEKLNQGSCHWHGKPHAFTVHFGEGFNSFSNVDRLAKQLDKEEFHDLKNQIICYLNGIEKGIDERVPHEEVLRIKERDVKERDVKERSEHEKRVNKFEMQKHEKMTNAGTTSDDNLDSTLSSQHCTCNSSRENTNVEDGKIRDDTDDKKEKQAKENCQIQFVILHTLLKDISNEDLTNTWFSTGFQRAFLSLFGEEVEYFAPRLFFNMDKLEKQLNVEELNEEIAMVVFKVFNNQFWHFINNQISMDYDDQMANKVFTEYTLCDAQVFKNVLINKMDSIEKAIIERGMYKSAHDSRVNKRTMQRQKGVVNMFKDKCYDGLVVKERRGTKSEMQNESSRSRNDTKSMHKDAKQCLDKRPLIASKIENKTTESLNQTLDSENDCLKKTIAKLQKDFSKLEAQKNENFLASLQIENAHLKQTYKDLFESIQSSKVENSQCDEVKLKFDKIETQNIELEHQVTSLLKENEHLKLVYNNLFDLIKKPQVQKENLKSTLSEFAIDHILGKDDSSPSSIAESNISELEKESGENICENAKCELQTKIVGLEKILTQKTKDFDDVKLELSKRTAKFEAYFEKLENTKVVLERQLARKVDDSKAEKDQFLKEINHLRTQLENLKGKSVETKFDKPSILGKPPADKLLINSQISKSWFTPKVVVQKDLSKPVTAQSA
ncbi:hypothetical protein Tco_0892042 [Tanacetum coccineum]|uniref:Uncharacterized protein n=1 Tax=Tanacetum coccineum TaxID=301880 RepID=A0ABQ5C4Q6_9ASTR